MNRREFLKRTFSTGTALALLPSLKSRAFASSASPLFPQSVASGDVDSHRALLWTRLASEEAVAQELTVQVALDRQFQQMVTSSTLHADPAFDFTVRADLSGLSPGTRHFYRFLFGKESSPIGEFKTLPENPDSVRFAFVSCQDYGNGYYSAYYHLAQEPLDFVVFLGDYIYETTHAESFQHEGKRPLKLHGTNYAYTLEEYRTLYKIYKSDPYLQRVHERFPFFVIWDDHEFSNDCAGAYAFDNGTERAHGELQVARRRNASRAFYEYLPARILYDLHQSDFQREIQIYRSVDGGKLFRLLLTDERLYRDRHPCGEKLFGGRYAAACENNETTSMLGKEQKAWFLKQLADAEQKGIVWKVHGNEVGMTRMLLSPNRRSKIYLNLDQWDGYAGERKELLHFLKKSKISNYFVITGDLHTFVVSELYEDFDQRTNPVGTEFITTSITSANLGQILRLTDPRMLAQMEKKIARLNRQILYFNSHSHGYTLVTLTKDAAEVELVGISSIAEKDVTKTTKKTLKKYRIRAGSQAIESVS